MEHKYKEIKMRFLKNALKTTGVAVLLTLFLSCKNKTEAEHISDYKITNDSVIILEQHSTIKSQLKLYKVQQEAFQLHLTTAGTVKAIPNFYTEIASPYAGRVTKVYLKLGMQVNAGTPLFEINSPDFTEIQKKYFASKTEYKKAVLNLKRQKDLKLNGVGAIKDLEEAEAEYEIALKEYENSRSALKVFNINPETLTLGQPLVIRSPIKGQVISNEIINGHYMREDDDARAVIAQLDKVWVVGQVKEKDMRFIKDLESAEINVAAYPDRKIPGKIYYTDEIIDEETRSIRVMIECENKDLLLKPGMYVTVTFTDHTQDVVFVPSKAVFQMDDNSFVFIQTQKDSYVRRKVKTDLSENGRIRITEGIKTGDVIVSQGGFYLLEVK